LAAQSNVIPPQLHALEKDTKARISALSLHQAIPDANEELRADLLRVCLVSEFVLSSFERYPALLPRLHAHHFLQHAPTPEQLTTTLNETLLQCDSEEAFEAALRHFRREQMIGIIWRDLCRQTSDVRSAWDTSWAVTQLAEVILQQAIHWLQCFYQPRWGQAVDEEGRPMSLIVLGMGKFGAGELNLSSDIDLIFVYRHEGSTQGGRRSFAHQEYFTRIGQRLIHALDAPLMEGFVFRVDMRLRPLGEGSPLVSSFASIHRYYQEQGREWERFALLKARPVAGDTAAGYQLLNELKPFIYRRYLDFGAIQSLRDMKVMINREVRRRGLEQNIKLGAGGIREIEFVVQVFQLMRGGRDTELQTPSLQQAIKQLEQLGLLPAASIEYLQHDYLQLRDIEHVLQGMKDTQTQTLPADEEDRERLAYALGYTHWDALAKNLTPLRARVHEIFESVISAEDDDDMSMASDSLLDWFALWRGELEENEALALLAAHQFEHPQKCLKRIEALKQSRPAKNMQRIGLERLDALMPALLDTLSTEHFEANAESVPAASSSDLSPSALALRRHFGHQPPDIALERVLTLIESVLRRTAYLSLLRESDSARVYLVRLCAASAWIADELSRYPMLLDELLTPAELFDTQTRQSLTATLDLELLRIPGEDEEAQLEALRRFKHAQVLSVAASDLAGVRPLMHVSDILTLIAEVLLERVVTLAWRSMVARYGEPSGLLTSDVLNPSGFTVVGYGKLGGIELGYGSDLDLVFIYDTPSMGMTNGARSIDNTSFFTRLGQRIIHLLTAMTPSGVLYEVDMRLRPSGNSGLLVSTIEAFAEYQRHQAWTWEHQALVRARPVAGDRQLGHRFETLRQEILSQPRDRAVLRSEVVLMREKMHQHLDKTAGETAHFDIKQSPGGMIDIEFMSQYAVLAFSATHPALLRWTDNVRILEVLEEDGPWPGIDVVALRNAYLAYRDTSHFNALEKKGSTVVESAFASERALVIRCWQRWMAAPDM